jgi:tetrathionate reductase subunit A
MLLNIVENAKAEVPGITTEEILSKGGVFDEPGDEYDGEYLRYRYGNIIRTFADPVATTRDSVTGEYYSGVPQYLPQTHSDGAALSDHDYPYRLITYKTVHHGQARTNVNPWLMLMLPENPVEISAADAAAMRVQTGDKVKVSSVSNRKGIVGRAKVTQGLKPGVVAISHHYGHWEQHSRPALIDGVEAPHDPSRGAGLQPTLIMRTDGKYRNVSLQEPIGGSCCFYDTQVRVKKV